MMQNPLRFLLGLIVAVAGTALTVVAAVYLARVFWLGDAPDYNIQWGGAKVPPEGYAVLLVALWSAVQRLKAHFRPDHPFFKYEDLVTSLAFGGLIVLTFAKIGISNPSPTFLPVMGAFLVAAIMDVALNGRHRLDGNERILGIGGVARGGNGGVQGHPHNVQVSFPGITDRAGLEALLAASHGSPVVVVNVAG